MTPAAATLDRAAIAALVPHAGLMCLLERMVSCNADEIVCEAINQADAHHPLRLAGMLPAACALEYASQAMALHGALCAGTGAPKPGLLASARSLRLLVSRLDDAPGPLRVQAQRLAGDGAQAMYAFALHDGHARLLVDGRATVVFDAPLQTMPTEHSR